MTTSVSRGISRMGEAGSILGQLSCFLGNYFLAESFWLLFWGF